VHFILHFGCVQDLRAAIDPHGIWVEPKVFILVEFQEANEILILIKLKDVLMGTLTTSLVLVDQGYLVNAQVVGYNRV
jgi:hypothetical protein